MAEFTENQIDEYLLGKLDLKTHEAMDKNIKTNTALAKKVNNRRAVLKLVDAFGDLEMMDTIKAIHQKEMSKKRKIFPIQKWGLAIAAAVTLALGFFCWNWFSDSATPQELYAANYEPYRITFGQRDNSNLDETLMSAAAAYKNDDFKSAEALFNEYFSTDSSDSKIRLGYGISLLENGKKEKAFQQFNYLASQDFDRYKQHGMWYAALLHLENGEVTKAMPLLQKIADNDKPPFNKKAKKILSKL